VLHNLGLHCHELGVDQGPSHNCVIRSSNHQNLVKGNHVSNLNPLQHTRTHQRSVGEVAEFKKKTVTLSLLKVIRSFGETLNCCPCTETIANSLGCALTRVQASFNPMGGSAIGCDNFCEFTAVERDRLAMELGTFVAKELMLLLIFTKLGVDIIDRIFANPAGGSGATEAQGRRASTMYFKKKK